MLARREREEGEGGRPRRRRGPRSGEAAPARPADESLTLALSVGRTPGGTARWSSLGLTAKRFAVEGGEVGGGAVSTSVPEVDVVADTSRIRGDER